MPDLFNSELFKNVPADDFADRWLPWAWGALGANGKRRKVPARIVNGTLHIGADAHGDDGQMPLSDVLKVAAQFPDQVAGIGYCLREDDELLFVDADGCFDASGELHADVQRMVDMSKPCFVEKSVSENGIHIVGYGDAIPPRAGHKSSTPAGAEVERYTDKRFICITGNIIGDPVHKLTSLDDLAEWLNETTFTREVTQPKERLELDRDEPHDVAVALTCLPKLDNKRRQDESEWYRVANACAEISDDLKEPFEEWSKGAGAEFYCPNDGFTKFEQCLRAPSYSGEPQRGVGTLLAMAAEDAKTEASIIIIEATEKLGRNRTDFKQDAASERAQDFSADIASLPYPRATNTHAVAFPTEYLPHIPQRFVREVARSVGCSESMPATFALGALSSGVCSAAELIIKSGWVVQPILWVAVVSESGSCKSPVETACLKPVRLWQRKERADFNKEAAEFIEAKKVWLKKQKAAEKNDEEFDEPPPTAPPSCPQRWVSDVTPEALALCMCENPRGILQAVDELTGMLGGMNRYHSGKGDEALYLSSHKASPHEHKRKTGERKTISIDRAALTISGGIQPALARSEFTLERRRSGMIPRFLMAMPPRVRRAWTEDEISIQAESLYESLFEGLYAIPLIDCEPVRVRLSPEAKAAFVEWYGEHAEYSSNVLGDAYASMSKIEELPARLALLFHCIDHAAGNNGMPLGAVLEVHHMQAAIEVARWYRHEAQRTWAMLEQSEKEFNASVAIDSAAARILKILKDAGTPLTRSEIYNQLPPKRITPHTALAALADLVARGDCSRDTQAGEYFYIPYPTNQEPSFSDIILGTETPAVTVPPGDTQNG